MSQAKIVQADVDARSDAQDDAFDDSVTGMDYYAENTSDKVFRAGLLAGMAWVTGAPGRRAEDDPCGLSKRKMDSEVRKGVAAWKKRLHQSTDYSLCFRMAWDRGEVLAEPKKS